MPADRSSDFESRPISEEISPANQETLQHIASFIRLAETFRVVFVKCNQPVQCRQMAARLKEMLAGEADLVDVVLKEPVSSLRRAALVSLELGKYEAQAKRAIQVFGFERSIPSEGPAPALDELNQSRENFPKSFFGPFLIWLPDYALTRLAREAPDFWGWRSGVFEFSPERDIMIHSGNINSYTIVVGNAYQVANSDIIGRYLAKRLRDLKVEKAEALQKLILEYLKLQRNEREDKLLSEVLLELGTILGELGEHDKALRFFQWCLDIAQKIGNRNVEGRALGNIGIVYFRLGDNLKAIQKSEQALSIHREVGDTRSEGRSLAILGDAFFSLNDYQKAIQFYEQALNIYNDIGDNYGEGGIIANLGNAYSWLGENRRAIQLSKQALAINHSANDQESEAVALFKFSLSLDRLGERERAIKMANVALNIFDGIESPIAEKVRQKLSEWQS